MFLVLLLWCFNIIWFLKAENKGRTLRFIICFRLNLLLPFIKQVNVPANFCYCSKRYFLSLIKSVFLNFFYKSVYD